jgi:single-strand DNA-binding protein
MNVVVLRGHLSRPPESRQLPSGAQLVTYEVTVDREGSRAETVPVVWEADGAPTDLEPDTEVVVVGRVRRRFFRAGGSTQSRTEVVAEGLVPARLVKRADRPVAGARSALAGEAVP